jgi:hypothetical protein
MLQSPDRIRGQARLRGLLQALSRVRQSAREEAHCLAMVGGALIAGIAGHMAEQAIQNRHGIEYTIDLDLGKTITIVQEIHKEDKPLEIGQRCMVQTSGTYQRVLPSRKPFQDERKSKRKTHHNEGEDDADDDRDD